MNKEQLIKLRKRFLLQERFNDVALIDIELKEW